VQVDSTLAVSSSPTVTIVAQELSLGVIVVTNLANRNGRPNKKYSVPRSTTNKCWSFYQREIVNK